jgi:DNA-binding transcriptional ArsR family regulator
MRAAGFVDTRRKGTTVFYRLAEPAIVEACSIVDGIARRRLGQLPAPARPLPSMSDATASGPTAA